MKKLFEQKLTKKTENDFLRGLAQFAESSEQIVPVPFRHAVLFESLTLFSPLPPVQILSELTRNHL
jgi:hypothetical protein